MSLRNSGCDTRLANGGDAATVATGDGGDGCSKANVHSVSEWSGSRQTFHGLLDPDRMAITVAACRLTFNSCQGCGTANTACCWPNHLLYSSQLGCCGTGLPG